MVHGWLSVAERFFLRTPALRRGIAVAVLSAAVVINASAHGRETTRSRVRTRFRESQGHCGDAGECARAQLLGHDRRREQPVIFVWVWQTATAHKARAVAGRAVTGRAARPAVGRLPASTVGAAQALANAARSRGVGANERRRLAALSPPVCLACCGSPRS